MYFSVVDHYRRKRRRFPYRHQRPGFGRSATLGDEFLYLEQFEWLKLRCLPGRWATKGAFKKFRD